MFDARRKHACNRYDVLGWVWLPTVNEIVVIRLTPRGQPFFVNPFYNLQKVIFFKTIWNHALAIPRSHDSGTKEVAL